MAPTRRVTVPDIRSHKVANGSEPLVMVTAYDAPGSLMADEAGVDVILVGDTLAMVVLGYEDTLQVTIDDMAHHTAAVARARPTAMVLGDLPWLTYHLSTADAVRNAATLVRAGAGAVKLEGGAKRVPMVRAIVDAEIPVVGHIGLTPQSVHALGGFKVQGKEASAVRLLLEDAHALVDAGVFAIVLEAVPDEVARMITEAVPVPTIGIGAGRHCDGQVLVFHDLLGLQDRIRPKFVRTYATLKVDAVAALRRYAGDVRSGDFPSDEESYHLPDELAATFGRDAAVHDPTAPMAFYGEGLDSTGRPLAVLALGLAGAVALVAGCGGGDGDDAGRRPLAGFDEVAFTIEGAGGGTTARWCALLAETTAARARGLMGQDDLRGYDGMLFRFEPPRVPAFHMFRTTLSLSIAWFGADGAFVAATDMDPCPADDADACPTFGPDAPAAHALEVAQGELARLGVGPGSRLAVLDEDC